VWSEEPENGQFEQKITLQKCSVNFVVLYCFQGCDIRSGPNERLLMERACAKTLTLESNRSVSVEFDRFDVVFPYDYNFAACLDEACIEFLKIKFLFYFLNSAFICCSVSLRNEIL